MIIIAWISVKFSISSMTLVAHWKLSQASYVIINYVSLYSHYLFLFVCLFMFSCLSVVMQSMALFLTKETGVTFWNPFAGKVSISNTPLHRKKLACVLRNWLSALCRFSVYWYTPSRATEPHAAALCHWCTKLYMFRTDVSSHKTFIKHSVRPNRNHSEKLFSVMLSLDSWSTRHLIHSHYETILNLERNSTIS